MLSAGTLAIVFTRHNHRIDTPARALRKIRHAADKRRFGCFRNIGAQRYILRPCGRNLVSRHMISQLDDHVGLHVIRKRIKYRHGAYVRPADNLRAAPILRREDQHGVVLLVDIRFMHLCQNRRIDNLIRARQTSQYGAGSRRFRRGQVYGGIHRAAPAFEIPVGCTHGNAARPHRLTHAYARPASAFQNARAALHEDIHAPILDKHSINLPRAGADHKAHIRRGDMPLEYECRAAKIAV